MGGADDPRPAPGAPARPRPRAAGSPGGAGAPEGIGELASILLRIEAKLGRLLEVEQRAVALEPATAATPAPAPVAGATETVAEATIVQVAERAVEGAPPRSTRNGGASVPPLPPPPATSAT